ncbi:MAG: DnaJ domain-containing protein, partial [Pyramidobacter sp.]|nr:DnaJ domain-containing protein [Pyramidobacter sp.]
RLFSGFFGLFGWLGTIVMWLVIIAAVIFGGMTVVSFFSGAKKQSASSSGKQSAEEEQPGSSAPPRFAQRAWALNELGLPASASASDIKSRYHELVKRDHPDRLGPNATAREREQAQKRMERLNQAYETLSH